MATILGTFSNGRVEFDGPPPNWAEGSRVKVEKPEIAEEPIDITGDSPEAIAAWMVWYDQLHMSVADSTFPEELDRILAEDKSEELARWNEDDRRSEALFP